MRGWPLLLLATLTGCGGFVVTIGMESPDGSPRPSTHEGGFLDAGRDAITIGPDVGTLHDSGLDAPRGDSTSPPPDDSGAPRDAHAVCPTNKPTLGSNCPDIGLECEYGSNPSTACNTIFTCEASGWTELAATGTCVNDTCPSYTVAAAGGVCSPGGMNCAYPQGTCTCAPPTGPLTDEAGLTTDKWQCFPAQVGCPNPRPAIGDPCTAAAGSTVCNYGACADGIELTCKNDVWTEVMVVCSQ